MASKGSTDTEVGNNSKVIRPSLPTFYFMYPEVKKSMRQEIRKSSYFLPHTSYFCIQMHYLSPFILSQISGIRFTQTSSLFLTPASSHGEPQ